jgi:hypothetical protein
VTYPGFSTLRYDAVRVKLNEQQTLQVPLLEKLEQTVRAIAERGVVDLDKSETSTRFSDEFISDLPVLDRFYQNVLVLAPGVQDADGDGSPNVHGSRARDFQAIVSGVSNVDPLTGQWLSRINPNSIEEMEVITAGAGVEFGRAQGGFARVIQKQGSNRHEGIIELHYQTSELDNRGADDASELKDPDYETIQPGFQFSGPIVKDKLWYRASYERRDREEPINVQVDFEIYNNESETRDLQLTWQASPRNKFALQYRSDPATEENFGISGRVPVESSQRRDRDVDTWTIHWTAPQSPEVLVESTVAWQEVGIGLAPQVDGVLNSCIPDHIQGFLKEAQCLDLTQDTISGSFGDESEDVRQRLSVKSQATIYAGRLLGANHQLKLGFNVENERYFRTLRRSPTVSYDEEFPPLSIPFAIVSAEIQVPETDDVRATGTNWAFYVEDQIKPTDGLTITLGARDDREELTAEGRRPLDPAAELAAFEATLDLNPFGGWEFGEFRPFFTGYEEYEEYKRRLADILCDGQPAGDVGACQINVLEEVVSQNQDDLESRRLGTGINIANTNLSPFLSLAWSPWADGKTAFKVAVGRHYNNIPLVVPLQELEPASTSIEYVGFLEEEFTPHLVGGITPNISVSTLDHGVQTSYQDEWTVSLERELWRETSLQLTYVNREFRDQLQDVNINVGVGDYGRCAAFFEQFNPLIAAPVVASPGGGEGSGLLLTDPWTGQIYEDTVEGVGDGFADPTTGSVHDNCAGAPMLFGLDAPDEFTDLYTINPFWGDILEIGNNNEIDYEAVVLELVRRHYRNWELNTSYTWSETIGDGEDFSQELGNDPAPFGDIRGYQSYDQRHVVKLNATTITPWGLRLGTAVTWQSGLPFSVQSDAIKPDIMPPSTAVFAEHGSRARQFFPTGGRNDQRNKSFWNVDLKGTKELAVGRDLNLQLSVEVFNALNDETYQIYNPFLEEGRRLNGLNEGQQRLGRRWQVGLRIAY